MLKYNIINTGDILENNQGVELIVLEIKRAPKRCVIEFTKTKTKKEVAFQHLRYGKAKDPYHKVRYGVACLGNPPKYAVEDYRRWDNMIERCYNERGQYTSYEGATVCERWLCFEYFLEDLKNMNGYGLPNRHLDKDLKSHKKIYSLENCQLINNQENSSHGKFQEQHQWVATSGGGTVIKAATSSELGRLLQCAASTIRQKMTDGYLVKGSWKITQA